MLKSPRFMGASDPVMAMMAQISGNGMSATEVEEGAFIIPNYSFDIMVWGQNAPKMWMGWPDLGISGPDEDLNSYGVCDKPAQFLDRYRDALQSDVRTFAVGFTHVQKHPENKGNGGGWRWHKWGPYIGDGNPTAEYLDDEELFDEGVCVYSVLEKGLAKRESGRGVKGRNVTVSDKEMETCR